VLREEKVGEVEVLYDVSDAVGRITINRPERRNALSPGVIRAIEESLERAKQDSAVRVVVLTGAGDKAFCAGADLGSTIPDGDVGVIGSHYERGRLASVFVAMSKLGKPIVSRVNGHALAGGFGLAAAADFVVASETATFGTPEIDVGLWPMMITVILRRAMPPKKVLQLMMTGKRLSAREAESLGVVDIVTTPEELDAAVDDLVATLKSKSPAAMRIGRDAFYTSLGMPDAAALEFLQAELSVLARSEDAMEGITAFLEKREPRWKAR
jgi:enoyl-CoA hydratase